MTRLAAALRLDARVQRRNRLYAIGITIALVLGAAGRWVFPSAALPVVIPAFYLLFVGGSTYMFVAAMILLERGEGTLDALRVTPLRTAEYLTSKVVTLSLFSLVEGLIVLLVAFGATGYSVAPLAVGLLLMGAFLTLVGIAQVVGHEKVTDFLIPGAMVVMLVFQLPLFHFLGMWQGAIWYAIPTRASLLIIEAAFRPLSAGEWTYALAYSVLAVVAAAALARRRFVLHVLRGGRTS